MWLWLGLDLRSSSASGGTQLGVRSGSITRSAAESVRQTHRERGPCPHTLFYLLSGGTEEMMLLETVGWMDDANIARVLEVGPEPVFGADLLAALRRSGGGGGPQGSASAGHNALANE